jgi:hypothetical protein
MTSRRRQSNATTTAVKNRQSRKRNRGSDFVKQDTEPFVEDAQLSDSEPFVEDAQLPDSEPFVEDAQLPDTEPILEDVQLPDTEPFVEDAQLSDTEPLVEDAQLPDTEPLVEDVCDEGNPARSESERTPLSWLRHKHPMVLKTGLNFDFVEERFAAVNTPEYFELFYTPGSQKFKEAQYEMDTHTEIFPMKTTQFQELQDIQK